MHLRPGCALFHRLFSVLGAWTTTATIGSDAWCSKDYRIDQPAVDDPIILVPSEDAGRPGSSAFKRDVAGCLPMGFLRLLNRVEGKRGSIDFRLLKDHDVVVLVDNSTRMLRKGRWDEVSGAIAKLAAKVYKYNKRGIDVHFLNQKSRASTSLKTKSRTRKLFAETTLYYGQPIGARLNDLFDQYVREACSAGSGNRKRDILVISDADDLESVLVNISNKLDELEWPKSQLRIQLVQVGNDSTATQFLQRLEEDLPAKHNIDDLVNIELCDGNPLTMARLEGVLLKSVARHSGS